MTKVALYVQLEAKPGKEAAVESFLRGALPLVNKEPDTSIWFAMRMSNSTFGIFDAFPHEAGRQAHLHGEVAKALFAQAEDLFAKTPTVVQIDILAEKLPT